MPPAAVAAAQDYRFEVAGPPAKSGKATIVKIRLVHIPDGKPVPGAVIFQTRFDMGPDGMASMTAPAKLVRSSEANLYQLELEPQMGGNWRSVSRPRCKARPRPSAAACRSRSRSDMR